MLHLRKLAWLLGRLVHSKFDLDKPILGSAGIACMMPEQKLQLACSVWERNATWEESTFLWGGNRRSDLRINTKPTHNSAGATRNAPFLEMNSE